MSHPFEPVVENGRGKESSTGLVVCINGKIRAINIKFKVLKC